MFIPIKLSFIKTFIYLKKIFLGKPANEISFQQIPCTVTSMDFFSRITAPDNGITYQGSIKQCMEETIDGFYVNDNLRAVCN